MPMSEAAILGIVAHGSGWRHELRLKAVIDKIADFDETTPREEISAVRDEIVAGVRTWLQRFNKPEHNEMRNEIDTANYDLEMVDESIDEVRYALGVLYDQFDYYRVVVL